MLSKASDGRSLTPTTWVPNTLQGFFERIYPNQTPLMADQLTLHELLWHYMTFFCVHWIWKGLDCYSLHYISSLYTTWVFEAYALKGICWLVPSSHYMSSQYTTWLFRTYILESNASDGWPTYTTWTPLTLHNFFFVYTGSERALMADL